MIKTRAANGKALVTFTLDGAVGARTAALCGDFNGWSGDAHRMERAADGSFRVTVELEPGRAYRFRYLLDDSRWENDWAADGYVPNNFGGDDSVVDVTALAEDGPAPSTASSPSPQPASPQPASPQPASPQPASPQPAKKVAKKAAAAKVSKPAAPTTKTPATKAPTKGASAKVAAPAKKAAKKNPRS